MKESEKFTDSNLIEGMISVRAVIESALSGINDRKIERLFYASTRAEKKKSELAWLRHRAEEMQFPIVLCDPEEIDRITIGTTHGGVAAFCTGRTIPPLTEADPPSGCFAVMLEGIEDPYNFGYALRSLYAAGADMAVLSPRNWMTAAGVVCRASAGASERMPLYIAESGVQASEFFRTRGCKVVCADISRSVSVYDADLKKPLFLIVGGEKRGISRAVLDAADCIVRLDYAREFPEALSAASAASILGYEVYRQNR